MAYTTFHAGSIPVQFPYQPYQSQTEFCGSVLEAIKERKCALLESPTGTGKTLALLAPILAWHKETQDGSALRVYYATRTHSQTAGINTQLKTIVKGTSTRSVVLASRLKLCLNDNARDISKSENCSLTDVCADMRKQNTSSGDGSVILQKRVKTNNIGVCDLYHPRDDWYFNFTADEPRKPMDIEDMLEQGRKDRKCAYYGSKALQENSNLTICTYNHLLYPYIRKFSNIKIEDAVLVFDEAHNIEAICRKIASKKLNLKNLDDIIQFMYDCELKHPTGTNSHQWKLIRNAVNRLAQFLHNLAKSNQGFVRNARTKEETLDMTITFAERFGQCGWGPTDVPKIKLAYEALREILDDDIEFPEDLAELIGSFNFMYQVANCDENSKYTCDDYALTVVKTVKKSPKKAKKLPTLTSSIELRLICNNAAVVFKELAEKARSVIIISGTLSPIPTFAAELGLHSTCIQKSFEQVLPPDRLFTCYVGSAKKAEPNSFTFKYDTMELDPKGNFTPVFKKLAMQLSNTLEDIFTRVPNGNLVFFPSKTTMTRFVEYWKKTRRFAALKKIKPIYIETDDEEFETKVARRFKTGAKSKKGAVLFAYIRGKASEGVDFKYQEARAVVCVGVPYANINSVEVKAKMKFNDDRKCQNPHQFPVGGQEWYNADTLRALNQALGRGIRCKDDWACVFLIDQRFLNAGWWGSSLTLRNGISSWINRPGSYDSRIGNSMEEIGPHVTTFVDKMKQVS